MTIQMNQRKVRRTASRFLVLMMVAQQLVWTPLALAADNPVVVGGAATIVQQGTNLDVTTQTDRTIINWDKFNIPGGHSANFYQPNANSAVLNRVITNHNPSAIYGTLNSNGNVFLVNPSGIVVGPSGVINTNGFTASVLDIANDDFMRGNLNFQGDSRAQILNQGRITTGAGGAALIGNQVINEGLIESNGGSISLINGGSVQLKGGGTYTQADQGTLVNGISETAALIKNSGTLRATGALEVGGEIYLVSPGGSVIQEAIAAASKVDAQGDLHGGKIVIDSGAGETIVSGETLARGQTGGEVIVTGENVKLQNALIDVSGETAGGNVAIGGGYQGKVESIANSRSTFIDAETLIRANALDHGDGGTVIIWSDGNTLYLGDILASGSGDGAGGFVEVSGKEELRFEGNVNTGGGMLLLDPYNYKIDDVAAGFIVGALNNNHVTITTNANNNIYGSEGGDGSAVGNISVEFPILWSTPYSLTMLAHGDILITASIQNDSSTGADLNLVAGWDGNTHYDFNTFWNANPQTTTLYGNGTGGILIGGDNIDAAVSVGSAHGRTAAFGGPMLIMGSGDVEYGHAQLGFGHIHGPQPAGTNVTTGDIYVGVKGDLGLLGGGDYHSQAQIGHGGNRADLETETQWNYTGDIALKVSGGIGLMGGARGSYTQIGHGGMWAWGNHFGNIRIHQVGNLYLEGGVGAYASSLIGHGSQSVQGYMAGDITIDQANNISIRGGHWSVSFAQIGHGGVLNGGAIGDITIGSARSLELVGGGMTGTFARLGHGGAGGQANFETSTLGGDIVIGSVGAINLFSGYNDGSAAQIGHGGYSWSGITYGDIQIYSSESILLQSRDGNAAFTMIGHGGSSHRAQVSGNIAVTAEGNISLFGGGGHYTFSGIGHLTDSNFSNGPISGNIFLKALGELSLVNGNVNREYANWMIGNTYNPNSTLGESNVTIMAAAVDYSSAPSVNSQFRINADFADKMRLNLQAGDVNLVSTNTVLGSAGGMTHDSFVLYDSEHDFSLISMTDINLMGMVQNSGSGNVNLVAGWNGTTGLATGNTFIVTGFNPTSFKAADVSTTTLFGNRSGSIVIGQTAAYFNRRAYGSAFGETNAFAHHLTLIASGSDYGHAMLGYFNPMTAQPGTQVADGDIYVGTRGDVTLLAGGVGAFNQAGPSAQIGHGGARTHGDAMIWEIAGDITINSAQSVYLNFGTGQATGTQIGHGGYRSSGHHSGDITVNARNFLAIRSGSAVNAYAKIGHGGAESTGNNSGNLTVSAGSILTLEAYNHTTAQIGHGGYVTGSNNLSGDIIVTSTYMGLVGGAIDMSYAHIGHGGAYDLSGTTTLSSGLRSGSISIHNREYMTVSRSSGDRWAIGHRTTTLGGIDDANITFRTRTLFEDTFPPVLMTYLNENFTSQMAYNLSGGHVNIVSDNTSDLIVAGVMSYTSPNTLSLLSRGNLSIVNLIQNHGDGQINVVAGWNGIDGLTQSAFDPVMAFDHTQLIYDSDSQASSFGQGNNSININSLTQQVGVGSAHGLTFVAGGDLIMNGGGLPAVGAQIGYHYSSGTANDNSTVATGDIAVFLTGSAHLSVGLPEGSSAQIGHGGIRAAGFEDLNWNLEGDIILESWGDSVNLYAAQSNSVGGKSYTQIGHGGYQAAGNHHGDIALNLHGDLNLMSGSAASNYAQIGHGGHQASGNHSGNILAMVEGHTLMVTSEAYQSYTQIGHGGYRAHGNHSGNHALLTIGGFAIRNEGGSSGYSQFGNGGYHSNGNHSGDLLFLSEGAVYIDNRLASEGSYVQVGHGGIRATGNHSGNILLGSENFIYIASGNAQSAYAQIGNGGFEAHGHHSGDHALISMTGISFESYSGDRSYTQFGNGGANVIGNQTGDLVVASEGYLSMSTVSGKNNYAQIGNGGIYSVGDHSGDHHVAVEEYMHIFSSGDLAYTQIGNGGAFTQGDLTGDHTLSVGGYAYLQNHDSPGIRWLQIGNGGYQISGNTSGNHRFNFDQELYAFANQEAGLSVVQIGNGGHRAEFGGSDTGNLRMRVGGFLQLYGNDGVDRYAHIGHGGENVAEVSGNVRVSIGGGAYLTNSAIGHLVHDDGQYSSGNTFIAIGRNNFESTNTLSQLFTSGNTQFTSAGTAQNGQLRFYAPRRDGVQFSDGTLINGRDTATFPQNGRFPNEQGDYRPFRGPYNIDESEGNFGFYFPLIDIAVRANDGTSTYGDLPTNPGMSLISGSLNGTDTLQSIGLTTDFNLTRTSDVDTYLITVNTSGVDSIYRVTSTQTGTYIITRANLTITPQMQEKIYGDNTFELDGTKFVVVGLKNNEQIHIVSLGSLGVDPLANVGNYDITVNGIVSASPTFKQTNYNIQGIPLVGGLAVLKADLYVTALDRYKLYGDTLTLDGTQDFIVTGLRNNDTVDSVTLTSPGTAAKAPVGRYDIALSNPQGSFNPNNYNIIEVDGNLYVAPLPLLGELTEDQFDRYRKYFRSFQYLNPPTQTGEVNITPQPAQQPTADPENEGEIPEDQQLNTFQLFGQR